MNRVREISGKDWGGLSDQFVALFEPVVIRALVEHWPVVKSFDESGEQGLNYVRRFANDRPVTVYVGEPEISGRFGYSDELTQSNFKSGRIPLEKVLDRLISQQDDAEQRQFMLVRVLWICGYPTFPAKIIFKSVTQRQ